MNVMDIFETMEYGPAPESATPALQWIKEHQPFGLFINNQWVAPASGQYLESINPANGKPLWHVNLGNSVTNGPITYELDGTQYLVVGAGDTLYGFAMLR